MIKNVEVMCWLRLNDKTILIIGDKWEGKPKVASPVDLLLISKKIKNRYKQSFTSDALKNCKVIYMDQKYKKKEEKEVMNLHIKNDPDIIYNILDISNCHIKVKENGEIVQVIGKS